MSKKIGLHRTSVCLENNYEYWASEFKKEEQLLRSILDDLLIEIEHVGSTAINHIFAKPIIDIAIAVSNESIFPEVIKKLTDNGYILRPDNGDDERIFIVKGNESNRTHYIHIHPWRSKGWFSQLYFRDFLNSNIKAAKQYEILKINLSHKYPNDRQKYSQGKDVFISEILSSVPYSFDDLFEISNQKNIPHQDLILIMLNMYGINADIESPRIRTNIFLDSNKEEFFYLGLPNNNESCFYLVDNDVYLYNKKIGTVNKLENDDCATSYFRKSKTVITLNSNSRSVCIGCKFCPNNLELNSEDSSLDSIQKIKEHFNIIMKHKDLSTIERLTICTGCFGNEDNALEHLLLINNVAKEINFSGIFHYIGSEIISNKAFSTSRSEIKSFMYTFTIECFSKRDAILKDLKRNIKLSGYYENMKRAMDFGFIVNYIYVLGLDSIDSMELNFRLLSEVSNNFPLINIFQPHITEHKLLMDKKANKIEYYLLARKIIEKIYKNTHLRPNSWECYRSLWYFKFDEEEMKCIRI